MDIEDRLSDYKDLLEILPSGLVTVIDEVHPGYLGPHNETEAVADDEAEAILDNNIDSEIEIGGIRPTRGSQKLHTRGLAAIILHLLQQC